MWVPCIGMALCSWLSFVDRQVLAILTPTIMQDTGLTPQHFTDAASFFFLAYTLGNPVWGSAHRLHGPALRACCSPSRSGPAPACRTPLMSSFLGFALARAVLGLGEGATFPGGLRTAVETLPAASARARDRAVVQRRHHRRGDDAAAARTAGHQVRLARRVPDDRRAGRDLAADLGVHRPAAVPARVAAQAVQADVAELPASAASGRWSSATRCRPSRRDRC